MKKKGYISPLGEVIRLIPYGQLLATFAHPEIYSGTWDRLNKIVLNIPAIGATEGMKEHPAVLHYFYGGTDMYIGEFDGKDEMFCFAIFDGNCETAEWGYSSLKAIKNPAASSGVSSLDKKFIILAGSIPRIEDRFTTFFSCANFNHRKQRGMDPGLPIKSIPSMNLDYYWKEQSIEMARYKRYPHYFKKPQSAE